MDWEISLYRDRDHIGSLPSSTQNLIRKQKLLTNGGQNVSFVGLLFHEKFVSVFLPRNSKKAETDEDKNNLASLILRTIQLYSKSFNSPLSIEDGELQNEVGGTSLSLISDLLNDYKKNGIYSKRSSVNTLNTGKPNWSKTISRSVAYPNNSNYIYLDLHSNKKITQSICEVAKIHFSIISEISDRFSVLLFGSVLRVTENGITKPSTDSIEGQIHILNSELRTTYSERDIQLIKSLIFYLKKIKGSSGRSMVIGIKHFHTVWEFMLLKTLANTVNVNQLLPLPSYRLRDDTIKSAPLKGQRLDVVLKRPNEDRYAVVDAKYYSAGSVSTAPGWPDLVKQFFYAKSLKEILPSAIITNAFVFPRKEGNLKSAHMIDRVTGTVLSEEYVDINCFYADPLEVMRHFVTNMLLHNLSQQLLVIETEQS